MERPAKRARQTPKAFENFTVGELKTLVERNDAFALKEAYERIEQLEQQLSSKEKEMTKLSTVDARGLAQNILKSIERQFQAQMLPEKDLSDYQAAKLTDKTSEGREVVASVPNVTPEIMSELGLQYDTDGNIKQKSADSFFRSRPMKILPGSGGACLRLLWHVNFKYTKISSELKVIAAYQWSAKPKPKAKAKAKAIETGSAAEEPATEVEGGGETAEAGAAEETAAPRKVAPSPAKPSPAKSPTPARATACVPAPEADEGIDVE